MEGHAAQQGPRSIGPQEQPRPYLCMSNLPRLQFLQSRLFGKIEAIKREKLGLHYRELPAKTHGPDWFDRLLNMPSRLGSKMSA
ncbi:uncharacterized protein CIMG_13764 [Coccidioides immitis RS]|uniref:Uncharacterized protein n=1 Tax=Coccidioides immitis (strain RS) TaxID=246410 RepID=J3KCR6_COCIM|nr:uncharacterized protein CIMG_13764 [Coccidioides immitis RS]EAS33062.3 hypothetical protein CIMG_13764 [Coccidioides immitis RS]